MNGVSDTTGNNGRNDSVQTPSQEEANKNQLPCTLRHSAEEISVQEPQAHVCQDPAPNFGDFPVHNSDFCTQSCTASPGTSIIVKKQQQPQQQQNLRMNPVMGNKLTTNPGPGASPRHVLPHNNTHGFHRVSPYSSSIRFRSRNIKKLSASKVSQPSASVSESSNNDWINDEEMLFARIVGLRLKKMSAQGRKAVSEESLNSTLK